MKNILKYKDYIGTVNFSSDDEIFYGKIEGINDLISFEADNVKDLKASFEEAVDDYLETCRLAKKNPEKSYKGSFNIRIDPELHKKAVYKSLEDGISLNKYIENAVKEKIERYEMSIRR